MRVTLLAFRQRVQTAMRFGVPSTRTRSFWTFALNLRLDRRCECEMLFPKPGFLPQTSQTEAMVGGVYRTTLIHHGNGRGTTPRA
jgi:hypothetical protein